jgi:hypothetical protein
MTVTLHLTPELEVGLLAQAQASGVSLEEYLLAMVEGAVLQGEPKALTPEQRADAYEKWSASHRATPPLPDFAVSREAMYQDSDAP